MIIGIDPAYTTTGVAISDDNFNILGTFKIKRGGNCYEDISDNHSSCDLIWNDLFSFIESYKDIDFIIEYPVLSSRSGAYLAILNGFIASRLMSFDGTRSITWVPPMACDSYIKNKQHSKRFIVDYCLNNGILNKRVTHDECTAAIFVKLLKSIRDGSYKNKSFVWYKKS